MPAAVGPMVSASVLMISVNGTRESGARTVSASGIVPNASKLERTVRAIDSAMLPREK